MPPTTVTTFGGKSFFVARPAEIQVFLRSPAGPVFREMVKAGERVKGRAISIAPRKTGNLAAHIVKRIATDKSGPVVLVGVENVPYAYYVHEGAPPHVITGKPLLFFFSEQYGHVISVHEVHHPGNKPNRFLVRALEAARI